MDIPGLERVEVVWNHQIRIGFGTLKPIAEHRNFIYSEG